MKVNALLEELRQLAAPKPDAIPKGWATAAQLCKDWNVSPWTMRGLLRAGIESGRLEKRMFRVKSGPQTKPVAHYREKKKSKS